MFLELINQQGYTKRLAMNLIDNRTIYSYSDFIIVFIFLSKFNIMSLTLHESVL